MYITRFLNGERGYINLAPADGGTGGNGSLASQIVDPGVDPIPTPTLPPPADPQPPVEPTPPPADPNQPYLVDSNTYDDQQKQLLSKYTDKGVTHINSNGDLTDKDGKVIIAKADIETAAPKYTVGSEITIGEDVYTINGKGDLVDKDNKVVKEAAEVEAYLDELQQDTEPLIDEIVKHVGIQVLNDKGEPVVYEDTANGVSQYIADAINQENERFKRETTVAIFDEFPQMKDVYNHFKLGGTLDTFNNRTDYTSITFDENNTEQAKGLIRDWMKASTQLPSDQIENFIAYYSDKGQLVEQGKAALQNLLENQQKTSKELAEQRAAKEAADAKELQDTWDEIGNMVKERKVLDYTLPQVINRNIDGKVVTASLDDFYKYMSEAVDKNGNSQADIDASKWTKERRLGNLILEKYLLFTNNDYSSLVNMKVRQTEVNKLRDQINKSKSKPTITIKQGGTAAPVKSANDLL